MRLEGWYLVDEPGLEPVATKPEVAWAVISATSQGTDVVIRHCNETQRAIVPVAVLEWLLRTWTSRAGTKP